MGLISQTIANLKGGVSQQPEVLKFPEQGSVQINGWSSETSGLQKRPPLLYKKRLGSKGDFGERPYIHYINRDEEEQYYVVLTGTEVKVFNLKGEPQTVSYNGKAKNYIQSANPRDNLRLLTIADYTFIVNTKKGVEPSQEINLPQYSTKKDALINVRGGQYGRTLEVYINEQLAAKHVLPDGSNANQSPKTDSQYIAKQLVILINKSMDSKFKATEGQGFVHIEALDGNEIESISTRDGYADQLINPVTHFVQSFNKLPINAPDGYIVKIVGDASSSKDEYYVKYNAKDKIWKETLGWNVSLGIDADTMPHVLVSQGSGEFRLEAFKWSDKTCGDDDTNPDPSFVDGTINDIFLYRNRLGILSGENVILSRTGKYGNFYPASIAAIADDDPIDLAVSSNRINILKFAVPFNSELLLWSDEAQFAINADGPFSATTINLNLVTSYDISDKARPYMIGKGVYFANPRSGHTSIYRYYSVRDAMDIKSAEDMTAHVPNYIKNGVFSIRGSTTENYCSVLTSGDPSKIFIYKFFYVDERLVQQSWSEWDFGSNVRVLANDAVSSHMFPIIETDRHIYLCHITFTQDTKDFHDEPYRYYMDAKVRYVVPTEKYNEDTGLTTLKLEEIYQTSTMPFKYGNILIGTVRGKVYEIPPPDGYWKPDDVLQVEENLERAVIFVGVAYEFKYVFSKFLIKQFDNNGKVKTVDTGRLQLKRAWVNYQHSGFFKIEVTKGGNTYVSRMTGIQLGAKSSELGKLALSDGQFRFACQGKAEDVDVVLTSDTPTPLSLIGCGWEGLYVRRTSSI